jgi:hypothetical protein
MKHRYALIGVLVTVILAGAGAVAYASIPDSIGVIHGCYAKSSGGLRVIDTGSGQHCLPSEVAISWSQRGPTGPIGSKGDTGNKGDTGATGPTGSAGPGVKTIAGMVDMHGTVIEGSGFSATRDDVGTYTVRFPDGTWNADTCPIATVTSRNSVLTPTVILEVCSSGGGGSFTVEFSGPGGILYDTIGFNFIAAQP